MPVLSNSKHEQFAQHVAAGHNLTKSYILAGYAEAAAATSACRLAKHPKVSSRIEEIRANLAEGMQRLSIRIAEQRLSRQQQRWDGMHRVIEERSADEKMQTIPGGKTGLLVRKIKQVGAGESAQLVEEYEVDTGLLSEIRKHEEHAAKELGQWTSDNGPGANVSINIAFPVLDTSQVAALESAPTIDLPPAAKRLLQRPSDGKPK